MAGCRSTGGNGDAEPPNARMSRNVEKTVTTRTAVPTFRLQIRDWMTKLFSGEEIDESKFGAVILI
jgi:hypothetical protein